MKTRGNDLKKVLIYGLDGSGKSTFAEQYCNDNNLNAIVIDVDDTNYTDLSDTDPFFSSGFSGKEVDGTDEFARYYQYFYEKSFLQRAGPQKFFKK